MVGQIVTLLALAGALQNISFGQKQNSWVRVGGTSVASGLAGGAGGPIDNAWYSGNGGRLLVHTAAGRVFETTDFEHWQLNQSEPVPARAGLPEQVSGNRTYALGGSNLLVSDNGGKMWINLTGFNGQSVVGGGADVLAVNPGNPQELTIGNAAGAWRSVDGGLTWHGLNDNLPNLPVARLLSQRGALLKDGTAIALNARAWVPSPVRTSAASAEEAFREKVSHQLGIPVSATAAKDLVAYAGTTGGRLFASHDSGATWLESPRAATGAVTRIWLDNDRPDVALAIAGNKLLRTINGGGFWDDVTGSMPQMQLRGVTADPSASVIYAATDRGVFTAKLSLNDAGAPSANWTSVSRQLPAGPAVDVEYNLDGTLTAALEGYGVFETAAPHHTRAIRLLNGADLSDRAAAPGSLVSVTGAKLKTARNGELPYPVLVASDSATQLQVPFESGTGVLTLALEAGSDQWTLPLTVKESAPALFVDADGAPLVLDAETGLVIDPKTALHAGARVQLLATGLGRVNPDWPTGVPAPMDSPPVVRGAVNAFLDGVPVEVTRATLAPGYVGYYTVELQLPQVVNRGASELTLTMNGEHSNAVKLFLESLPAGN